MTKEGVMLQAKKINNDEFYTCYKNVEKEIKQYSVEI